MRLSDLNYRRRKIDKHSNLKDVLCRALDTKKGENCGKIFINRIENGVLTASIQSKDACKPGCGNASGMFGASAEDYANTFATLPSSSFISRHSSGRSMSIPVPLYHRRLDCLAAVCLFCRPQFAYIGLLGCIAVLPADTSSPTTSDYA